MPLPHTVNVNQLNLSGYGLSRVQDAVARRANGSSSSRAASRASSGALILNASALEDLEIYFNQLMVHIGDHVTRLSNQAMAATQAMEDLANLTTEQADTEIQRHGIIFSQLEELEVELDEISSLCQIVKQNRLQLEELDRELDHEAALDEQHTRSHAHSSRHPRREGHRDRASGRHGR